MGLCLGLRVLVQSAFIWNSLCGIMLRTVPRGSDNLLGNGLCGIMPATVGGGSESLHRDLFYVGLCLGLWVVVQRASIWNGLCGIMPRTVGRGSESLNRKRCMWDEVDNINYGG